SSACSDRWRRRASSLDGNPPVMSATSAPSRPLLKEHGRKAVPSFGGRCMARGRRILIDGTMAKGGGGFTYLVNILPRLVEIAPEDRFRVLVRSERLARSIEAGPNLEIDLLPEVSPLQRLRFTYRDLPRLLKSWGAD